MVKTLTVAAIAATAFIVGGCASMSAPAAPAMLVGGVLVAPNGMTLYTFDKDTPGSGKSVCNGPCAALWPPLTAAATDQPTGAYSVVTRDDGARQWAYKGRPVHFYKADQKAGERNGDNFREVWHIIRE